MARTKGARAKKAPPLLRVPNFVKLYATGIRGGPTDQDFRFHVMNEKLLEHDTWHLVADALVIMTPTAAKQLVLILRSYVEDFEKKHGPIPTKFNNELTY